MLGMSGNVRVLDIAELGEISGCQPYEDITAALYFSNSSAPVSAFKKGTTIG